MVLRNKLLETGWTPEQARLPLERLPQAIDHDCRVVGGTRQVGTGFDVDGAFGLRSISAGLDTIADLRLIGDGLVARALARDQAAAVLGEDWLRVPRRSLP